MIKADARSDDVRKAFHFYKHQHDVFVDRCFHEEHDGRGVIRVNERGNLCADLPSLALTCRQVFREMWSLLYDGQRYEATILNLDFFPFLRFLHMLKTLDVADVTGDMVDLDYREVAPEKDDDDNKKTQYKAKFDNLDKLIQMHWLDDLPLWGCLAGRYQEDFEDIEDQSELEYLGIKDSRNALGNWLYAARQVVALYRINLSEWRYLSAKLLEVFDILTYPPQDSRFHSGRLFDTGAYWQRAYEEQLIQQIIGLISAAIAYSLGYVSNFKDTFNDLNDANYEQGKYGFFLYRDEFVRIAHEYEHSVVLLVKKYCNEVDGMLRDLLKDDHDEWEDRGREGVTKRSAFVKVDAIS